MTACGPLRGMQRSVGPGCRAAPATGLRLMAACTSRGCASCCVPSTPREYLAWVATGQQLSCIKAFVREHAPDVLAAVNEQQVAPLHTPEARAKYAQYRKDERAGKQADVPQQHKRCIFARSRKPKHGFVCDQDSKPLSEYYRDSRSSDGYNARCKRCIPLHQKVRPSFRTVHARELSLVLFCKLTGLI